MFVSALGGMRTLATSRFFGSNSQDGPYLIDDLLKLINDFKSISVTAEHRQILFD